MEFTEENRQAFEALVARYPSRRAAMLPALWLVQRQEGHISAEAMEYVGELLDTPPAEVQAVVSFYTMYDRRPPGAYKLQVCRTLSCALMGAYDILRHLEERLGIHNGATTDDGLFTLQEVECLGSCGTAPMMQVNDGYYENLTPTRVDELLERLRGVRPVLDRVPVIHDSEDMQRAIPRQVVSALASEHGRGGSRSVDRRGEGSTSDGRWDGGGDGGGDGHGDGDGDGAGRPGEGRSRG